MHAFSRTAGIALFTLAACVMAAAAHGELPRNPESTRKARVYISTCSENGHDAIYLAELMYDSGNLQLVGVAAAAKRASFLALHPTKRYLYSTCEYDEYQDSKGGALAAYGIDSATGNLTLLNHQSSGGQGPHYVSIDHEGKYALVANYHGGSVSVLPIRADGALGRATSTVRHHGSSINKNRQEGPHPHGIDADPNNRFVLVPDLGLDQVLAYRLDLETGQLSQNDPSSLVSSPGAGPRHIAFHPNGKWAYVINELDSTVIALRYDAKTGTLTQIDRVSTLPMGATGENITGEIAVHPNGRLLYASNRGHDSIAVFAIDQRTGHLHASGYFPAGGRAPRNFAIDPSGKFLLSANLDSDSVTTHEIDLVTGKLSPTGNAIKVRQPYCIVFGP